MKVHVVLVDYGLNGAGCGGVFDHHPTDDEVQALVQVGGVTRQQGKTIFPSTTGYGGWEVEEMEVMT